MRVKIYGSTNENTHLVVITGPKIEKEVRFRVSKSNSLHHLFNYFKSFKGEVVSVTTFTDNIMGYHYEVR